MQNEHQPYSDVYGAWRGMEELYKAGKIKAMGVANFYLGKFTEFAEIVETKPMVNQIELHPFYAQYDAIENMKNYGCVPQGMGTACRREIWYFYTSGTHRNWRKIWKECSADCIKVECTAWCFHYSKVCSR
jgi:predicted oxidoreductase